MHCKANETVTLPTANAPAGYTFLGWVTEEYNNCVDEHGDSDRLFHEDINDQDRDRNGDGCGAVQNAERLRNPEIQHIPRRRADVGTDRQIQSETVNKQTDCGNQHIQQDCADRLVFP